MSTSLTAKWLSKPLKGALVAPLLDGLNDARPKGSSKLGLDNLRRIFAADGTVIGPDVQAGSLVTADGEAIILRIEIGEAAERPSFRLSAHRPKSMQVSTVGGVVAAGGATFNVTTETAGGFTHPGLPSRRHVLIVVSHLGHQSLPSRPPAICAIAHGPRGGGGGGRGGLRRLGSVGSVLLPRLCQSCCAFF